MQKVSIIVPTYNRAILLKAGLESILKQDYHNIEIIVTDNASTDNTTAVVKAFNDSRIIYFKQNENVGMPANYNKALQLCSGEYIHVFSDDDLMLDGCIQRKVEILNKYPSVGLVHSDINIIDGSGIVSSNDHWAKKAWKKWIDHHAESRLFSGMEYNKYLYRIRNIICMPSVMIRKSVIDKIGYMDVRLNFILDLDYWLKITLFEDVFFINEKLISYRLYDTNVYNTITDDIHKKELAIVKDNLRNQFPDKIKIRNTILQDILKDGGYYTNYSLINPMNYVLKSALPFIPFEKLKKNFFNFSKTFPKTYF